jgi:N-acetyl-anhydromuramyl-L-alanine amidase AmpD
MKYEREYLGSEFWPASSPKSKPIEIGVIHYTGGKSVSGDLNYLKSVDKNPDKSASYHWLVGSGRAIELVPVTAGRSWHAGVSSISIDGIIRKNINNRSVGVAVTNAGWSRTESDRYCVQAPLPGTADLAWWEPYSYEDIDRLVEVCSFIEKTIETTLPWVGHQDVSPGRKQDPGPLFPWDVFHKKMELTRSGLPFGTRATDSTIAHIRKAIADNARKNSRASSRLADKLEDALAFALYSMEV